MKNIILLAITAAFLSTSCVSIKKLEEETALKDKYLAEKEDCNEMLNSHDNKMSLLEKNYSEVSEENSALKNEILELNKTSKNMRQLAEEEKTLREKTDKEYDKYMLKSSRRQEELTQELAEKERKLTKKELRLTSIQKDLEARESELQNTKNELSLKEKSLNNKAQKIEELQAKINSQNEAMTDLKTNIKKALKDFTSEDLTVVEKEGKIYVSLSEKLLFKAGSFALDEKGERAIASLAEVLVKQKNVDILVEGHTDSDAYKGYGDILDNWDLSVKRATSVVRVLEKNNVPKDIIVASGRGANKPITENKTKEEKAKNRRTEIILSPRLENLLNILQK